MPDPKAPPELAPESIAAIRGGNADMMRKAMIRSWLTLNPHEDRPMAVEGARWRHSWAAKCARATQYSIESVPESNPPDVASLWAFFIGQAVHDAMQPALLAMMPGAVEIEVLRVSIDVDGACSIDVVITFEDGARQSGEIKSINGFGFKKVTGAGTSREGPRHSAVVQLAMNSHALAQDDQGEVLGGWLLVLALENVSVGIASKNNFSTTERFTYVQYYEQAKLEAIAQAEITRVRDILDVVDINDQERMRAMRDGDAPGHLLVPRVIPDPVIPTGAVITDPSKGAWILLNEDGKMQQSGKTWHCDYCAYQSQCIDDGT